MSVRVEFDQKGIVVAIVAYKSGKTEAEVLKNLNKVELLNLKIRLFAVVVAKVEAEPFSTRKSFLKRIR